MLTTGTPLARSRLPLSDWVVIAWMIVLGLSAGCASRETARSYDRVYALMWRLIEAAIGHEADRHLSGTVEVDEIYVSCGHKAEPESAPNPVQPLSAPTGGAAGACGTVPVGATPTRIVPWSSCWFSAAGRG